MAGIKQLVTELEALSGVTIFNDGKIYDSTERNRTWNKLPFIQLIEEETDTSDHVGGGQDRRVIIRGRYSYVREISNNTQARDNIVSALSDNNLFELRIEEVRDVTPQLSAVDFFVESFSAQRAIST
jgi:hypothetical protein